MVVIVAESSAVKIDIIHSGSWVGSDDRALPGRTAAPRGLGALELAATSTEEETAIVDTGNGGDAVVLAMLLAIGGWSEVRRRGPCSASAAGLPAGTPAGLRSASGSMTAR